jgi:ATP-dependent Clp protease ATP-binding subunit ClpC
MSLEDELMKRVIGQEDAIITVSKAVRRARANLKDPEKPIGSFIFVGPTGVGKTELAACVAEIVFGSAKALIRLDMSEYMEKHSVSKLIGSPPGYVGYDEGGGLTEKVRRSPYSVILFDEIEKAHPDIFGLLLQILDNGILTDSSGHTANFKNTIIILTTNIGSGEHEHGGVLGFSAQSGGVHEREQRMKALKSYFRPELINRIDEIIVFGMLSHESVRAIARKMLADVGARIRALGVDADFDDSVSQMLADCEDVRQYGARPLRREIFSKIEDAFSLWMLDGKLVPGDRVTVSAKNGAIAFTKQVVS